MIKSPCVRDCPNCSMECRLTCQPYKEYRSAKDADYARRAKHCDGLPDHPGKNSAISRKVRRGFSGRK